MAVADKVKSIIVEQLGVDEEEVKPDASFVDDLGADSLDTWSSSWRSKRSSGSRSRTRTPRRSRACKEAVDYIERTPRPRSSAGPAARSRHGVRPHGWRRLSRRVVVTGSGWCRRWASAPKPRGQALCAGRSGIGRDHALRRLGLRLPDSRARSRTSTRCNFIEKKDVKKMDLFIQYAIAASEFAMDDAGLHDRRRRTGAARRRLHRLGHRRVRHHRARAQGATSRAARAASRRSSSPPPSSIWPPARCRSASAPRGRTRRPRTACSASAHAIGDAVRARSAAATPTP